MSDAPGNRWLVRAMTVGPTREALTRVFGARILARVAAMLPGVPVGFAPQGRELVHPACDGVEAARVGHVRSAWYAPARGELLAVLEIEAARIQHGLERIARDRRLHTMGISLLFDGPLYRDCGPSAIEMVDVAGVLSLDFVTQPAGVGAYVLRSVPECSAAGRRGLGTDVAASVSSAGVMTGLPPMPSSLMSVAAPNGGA